MIKLLYGISALAIVGAGGLFASCGMQWWHGAPADRDAPSVPLAERVRRAGGSGAEDQQEAVPPLVAQASTLALYLNPPKPPAPPAAPRPRVDPPPAPRPPASAPKFRLLSTSCHQARPEQSLALVSEPGREGRWVKKGDRLGHLVVESVEDGTLTCRDGSQLQKMTVTMKPTAELARVASPPVAVVPGGKPQVRVVNASRTPASGRRAPNAAPARHEPE